MGIRYLVGFMLTIIVLVKKIVDKNMVLKAKTFFENYSRAVFSMAIIAFIFSLIATITVLEYKEALGPNMMVALIALLYAGIINMVIINRKIRIKYGRHFA